MLKDQILKLERTLQDFPNGMEADTLTLVRENLRRIAEQAEQIESSYWSPEDVHNALKLAALLVRQGVRVGMPEAPGGGGAA